MRHRKSGVMCLLEDAGCSKLQVDQPRNIIHFIVLLHNNRIEKFERKGQ